MDSLTQLVLGASIGEAVLGKKIGNRALLWGGLAGTIPDLDVLARPFQDIVGELIWHRSLTHSFIFCLLIPPLLARIITKIWPNSKVSFREWTLMFFLGFLTHIALDCFTTWGTQVFWPFSFYPVSFKTIFVIDPLYTLPFLLLLPLVAFQHRKSSSRRRLNYYALAVSSLYLMSTLITKHLSTEVFISELKRQNIEFSEYQNKPTPLNTALWVCTAETDSAYRTGYYSFFDDDKKVRFFSFKKNHELLKPIEDHPKVKTIQRVTEGFYTVERDGSDWVINDLRFGQLDGWQTGEGPFVFSYRIRLEQDGSLSFSRRDNDFETGQKMLGQFFRRIFGA